MQRREFIKLAGAALASAALPITIKRTPVVYYVDMAITDLSLNKLVFWGDPQQHTVVKMTLSSNLVGSFGGNFDEIFHRKVMEATGLDHFKLEEHPWQKQMAKRMNTMKPVTIEDIPVFGGSNEA